MPTDQELKEHPRWSDDYYKVKELVWVKEDSLRLKGYRESEVKS